MFNFTLGFPDPWGTINMDATGFLFPLSPGMLPPGPSPWELHAVCFLVSLQAECLLLWFVFGWSFSYF